MSEKKSSLSRREILKLAFICLSGVAWSKYTGKTMLSPNSDLSQRPFPRVIKSIPTELPYFALTVDDGFDADALVKILDLMEEYHLTATFFMVGRYSIRADRKYPGIMKRMAELGNEIGYHTMTHELPKGGWQLDWLIGDHNSWLNYHKELLGEELFQKAVKPLARAPWDNFSKPFLRMCEHQRLLPVSWSNDPGSFNRGQSMNSGDIFLLHVRESDLHYFKDFSDYKPIKPVPLGFLIWAERMFQAAQQTDRVKKLSKIPDMK